VTLANWRDLSVILLALEAFILSLIPAALFYFSIRGVLWVLRQSKTYAPRVQGYFRKAAEVSEHVSQRMAAPIISISAGIAQARCWRSLLFPFRHAKKEV